MPNSFVSTRRHAAVICAIAVLASAQGRAQTHMGQPVDRHVTLVSSLLSGSPCPSSERTFVKLHPDGTRETTPFVVWGQDNLVITDVTWRANPSANSLSENSLLSFRLVTRKFDSSFAAEMYRSPGVRLDAVDVEIGIVDGQENLTSGVVAGPARVLCASAWSDTRFTGTAHRITSATLHGYVVPRN